MNHNVFGCYAEHKFAVQAMEFGLYVSFPLLHTSKYDCIVDSPKGLFKIQIKAIDESNRKRARVEIKCHSRYGYSKSDVDFFAVYSKRDDGFYIFKNNGIINSFEISEKNYSKFFNNFAIL